MNERSSSLDRDNPADAGDHGPQGGRLVALVMLRMLIGWHFLYEGLVKVLDPDWTAAGYLASSEWILAEMFVELAADPRALAVVDLVNQWGLVAIGLGLILGLFTQAATIAGIVLLSLYYIAHPPLPGLGGALPTEGSYLIVDKVLIEAAALFVLYCFPTGRAVGLDRLLARGGRDGLGARRRRAAAEATR